MKHQILNAARDLKLIRQITEKTKNEMLGCQNDKNNIGLLLVMLGNFLMKPTDAVVLRLLQLHSSCSRKTWV